MTPESYLNKPCSFTGPDGSRLVGIITECHEAPPFGKGEARDFSVSIRGNSGRVIHTTVCEAWLTLTETR